MFLILVELEMDSGLYMRETVWILPGVRVRIEKTTSLYERTGSIQPLVDWLLSH